MDINTHYVNLSSAREPLRRGVHSNNNKIKAYGGRGRDRFREKAPKRHYRYLFNRVPCNIPNDCRHLKAFDATVGVRPPGNEISAAQARERANAPDRRIIIRGPIGAGGRAFTVTPGPRLVLLKMLYPRSWNRSTVTQTIAERDRKS